MSDLFRRYGVVLSTTFVLLTGFWLLVLVILPQLYLFENSFRPYLPIVDVGGPKDVYSLSNYANVFSNSTDWKLWLPFAFSPIVLPFQVPIHLQVFFHTILFSTFVTIVSLAIAYPLAYYLAKVAKGSIVPTLFMLLAVPLWVSEILRSFAWFVILALKGPINHVLLGAGIIDEPVRWMTGYNSVVIGLVYAYILFMLFPVYNSVQSLDTNQIEASQDLGAPWWKTHLRVILPHCKPGIASGCVMVFMSAAGSILVPTLLASTTSRWFTEIIQQWMFESQDWNTGSAYAFILLLTCTIFVSVVMRLFRVSLSDIAK